jgi:predicted dehydrogenase
MMPDEAEVVGVASPSPGNAEAFARRHGIARHYTD